MHLRLHLLAVTLAVACASPRPPRTITPVSITDGDGVALGSTVELALDTDPTVIHEVVDFRLADNSIVEGAIVPSQGLVLIAKRVGTTTADLRTADGLVRTVTIVVKSSTMHADEVVDVVAGEVLSLGDDEITEWAASPPGSAVVAPSVNSPGFSVVANETGEVLLLLRSARGARIVHLNVHAAAGHAPVPSDEPDAATPTREDASSPPRLPP